MIVIADTLAEVEDDLAHGDHASARRRLREALVSRPHRLDLRLRLAELYRSLGDLPQAGRWGYLEDDAPQEEIDAFRTACGADPVLMLEALAWGEDDEALEEADEDDALVTATAWERIAELRRAVAAVLKAEPGRHHRHDNGRSAAHHAAVAYPFTPPAGITRPDAAPKGKPARKRERFGVLIIFVGIALVAVILLGIAAALVWGIGQFIERTYG